MSSIQHRERELIRALAVDHLKLYNSHAWSRQGFGMMRTYLGPNKQYRLNVWHACLAVPGVSTIHDHPWDFHSWILGGRFINRRYLEQPLDGIGTGELYSCHTIKTGEGGGPAEAPTVYRLLRLPDEHYQRGDTYHQGYREVHESLFLNGTVTINDRTRVGDGEHARVFWPKGQEWVDAEPGPVDPGTVAFIAGEALRLMGERW